MTADTKHAWKNIVTPDDLDAHMLEIGQVQANASLIESLMREYPPAQGQTIYMPGCGTGQIFDFISPDLTRNYTYLFSDLRPEFLEKLRARIGRDIIFRTMVDDIEASQITDSVAAVVIVLLLEHVNWRTALENILRTNPTQVFVIIQVNEHDRSAVNTKRALKPSIRQFAESARSELVDREDLEMKFREFGYKLSDEKEAKVPDRKRMLGLYFQQSKQAGVACPIS